MQTLKNKEFQATLLMISMLAVGLLAIILE